MAPIGIEITRMMYQKFMRSRDKRDGEDKTMLKTEKEYIKLHGGPDFEMHSKLTYLLTTVFMTMFFGFSLPILYPIALVGLTAFYFTDISMLFYHYNMPPSYDEKINKGVLKVLEGVPYFSLMMGIW
jgi:hypothetical protein